MERMIVQHLHTKDSGKKPSPDSIMDGELAINYVANGETLFIKNSEGAIAEFKDDKYYQKQLSEKTDKTLSLTYSELVSLRDNSQLIPGQQYRITDYTCTTSQIDTRSAGHVFDIIVTADDESTLNEEARAALHTGDTYFANSDLSAWKIWYCLDNDTTRFAWADSTNGKGVIYRMIDEWNNDVPYDFKNIQFKYPNDATTYPYYYYTFASDNAEDNTDNSLSISNMCRFNTIKEYIYTTVGTAKRLNFIIFIGNNCFNNTFGNNCNNNIFGNYCWNNTFGNYCYRNIFGNNCFSNTFGNDCQDNTFGNYCGDNTFGNNCGDNTFGDCCGSNTFGNNCFGNTFGNNCFGNTFGNYCANIKFALDKDAIIKYNYYNNNHFGDGCQYILFKGAETASSDVQVQNYNFAQGLKGPYNYLTIDGVRNRNFETKVEKNSNGDLKIFCLADLIIFEEDTPEPSQPSYPYSTNFIGDI